MADLDYSKIFINKETKEINAWIEEDNHFVQMELVERADLDWLFRGIDLFTKRYPNSFNQTKLKELREKYQK